MYGCILGVLHGQLVCAQRREARDLKLCINLLRGNSYTHKNAFSASRATREQLSELHVHHLTLTDLYKKLSGQGCNVTLSPRDTSLCGRKVNRAPK